MRRTVLRTVRQWKGSLADVTGPICAWLPGPRSGAASGNPSESGRGIRFTTVNNGGLPGCCLKQQGR